MHSIATSTPWYGTLLGSRSAETLIGPYVRAAMADRDRVARYLHLAGEAAMHAVVAQQVGVGLDAAEIVDRDGLEIVAPALDMARSTSRPIRPNPLMATFTVMCVVPSLLSYEAQPLLDEGGDRSGVMPKCR